jgi:hypothetical protein
MYLDLVVNTVLFADDHAVGTSDDLRLVLEILKFVWSKISKFQLLKNSGISTKCGSQKTNTVFARVICALFSYFGR